MSSVIDFIMQYPEATAAIAAVVGDIIAGAIPDKYLNYVGVARRIFRKIFGE